MGAYMAVEAGDVSGSQRASTQLDVLALRNTMVRVIFRSLGCHLVLAQPRRPGHELLVLIPAFSWDMGILWLVTLSVITYMVRTGEICSRPVATVLTIGFFSGVGCWGYSASTSLGTMVVPAVWFTQRIAALLHCP